MRISSSSALSYHASARLSSVAPAAGGFGSRLGLRHPMGSSTPKPLNSMASSWSKARALELSARLTTL